MNSYLLNRRGHYYFRIRVPSDLSYALASVELVKSLKTKNLREAEIAALPYQQGTIKTFSLLRSGFISSEQAGENIDRLFKRNHKSVLAPPAFFPSESSPTPLLEKEKKHLLSRVVKQFIGDRQHGWGPKTKLENECSYRLILDLLGDIGVHRIDRFVVRDLRDRLIKLPGNVYKIFPRKTAVEVLEIINDSPLTNMSPMSITTVNKHISRFSTLMKHCIKEGYIKDNPAVGLKIKQKRRPDEERKAYSTEDLKKMVVNLPPKEDKPERYWIPLVGMLSGLRLDEACQLFAEDRDKVERDR